jgi:hypothetical protein
MVEKPISAVGQGGSTELQSGGRGEPGVGDRMVQHMHTMLVEGVARPQHGHHVQQVELVLVEQSWE